MFVFYALALIVAGIAAFPIVLWRCLRGATYMQDFSERFGGRPCQPVHLEGCLWFHAASVGEVQGLQPVIAALHDRFPSRPVVLSTFTSTGKAMAQNLVPQAECVFLLPLDLPWTVEKVVLRLRPCALIVQETELWPNLYRRLGRLQVPIVVVNGRLSSRSFRRYALARPFTRRVLRNVALVLAQSDASAQRFRELGMPAGKVLTIGNTNIDRALEQAPFVPTHPMAPSLASRRVLVGGSTHQGEEAILVSVLRRLREQFPDLCLVLAPRHLERVELIVRHVRACGLSVMRRSQYAGTLEVCSDVIILDTLGELVSFYQLCTVAFVGGSLVPVGGHNILEPVMFDKPLLFGQHMHHFPELAGLLSGADGAIQVRNESELYAQSAYLLANPSQGAAMARRARRALDINRGALERICEAIAPVLGEPTPG